MPPYWFIGGFGSGETKEASTLRKREENRENVRGKEASLGLYPRVVRDLCAERCLPFLSVLSEKPLRREVPLPGPGPTFLPKVLKSVNSVLNFRETQE